MWTNRKMMDEQKKNHKYPPQKFWAIIWIENMHLKNNFL